MLLLIRAPILGLQTSLRIPLAIYDDHITPDSRADI
jgi:hypothetical protein